MIHNCIHKKSSQILPSKSSKAEFNCWVDLFRRKLGVLNQQSNLCCLSRWLKCRELVQLQTYGVLGALLLSCSHAFLLIMICNQCQLSSALYRCVGLHENLVQEAWDLLQFCSFLLECGDTTLADLRNAMCGWGWLEQVVLDSISVIVDVVLLELRGIVGPYKVYLLT